MEYLPGGDLYNILKNFKKFEVETARFIISQVILGI